MKINILNLIDFEEVNKLLEGFNQSTGFVTAILDLKGNIISKSGWRHICTEYHRVNPETAGNCKISDTVLANKLSANEKYHFYNCNNGLVDVAVPIVINGEHIANLFSGQFFFEEPDKEFFKSQAKKYGFNEKEYLKALEDVPIVSKERVKIAMDFLLNMTQLISEMTFQKLEQLQFNESLMKSEARYRSTLDHMLEGCQIIGFDWRYIYLNRTAEVHNRRPNDELIGKRYMDLWPGIESTTVFKIIKKVLETRIPRRLENEFIFPDGDLGWFDLSIQPVPEGIFILSIDITERKRQETKLLESEFRFSKMFENGPFGMVLADKDARFIKANPAFCTIMGYNEDEINKLTFKDLSYPDDLKKDLPNIKKLNDKEISVYKAEKRYIRKDGQVIWGSLTISAAFDTEGQFLYDLGIIEDITNRKRDEEKIILLNDRILTATRASQVGIWDWDIQNDVLTWDDQMYALYGFKKEEFTGAYEAWINGLHPDDKEFCKNETKLAVLGEKEYDTEFRLVWPDGTVRNTRAKGEVFRNEIGDPVRMVGINYDVTEQKKIEEKIRVKDQEFRKLSANVPDLIYQFTRKPDGTYFVPIASEGIRNIFGCSPEDVVDDFTPIARVIYPEDAERVIRDIEYSAEHLNHFTCEFRVQIPGREIQWIYSNSTPERLPDGSVTWYGFNVDITERIKAEDEIKKLNEALEERVEERTAQLQMANHELESFSYSVSHDLRAPLRHISGYVDLLNDRFQENLPEKGRHYLGAISDATKQMGTLIDDLLQFSRTGRQELRKAKLDMNVLVNEVLEKVKQDTKDRKIIWSIQKLPLVFGDYSLLKQVFLNLLDNAVKYTKFKNPAEISVEFIVEKENFVFLVRDNGVGFDMKYANKLFGVFQRLHSQTEFEGTGIGLANVQRIVQKHRGNVWAEAEPNKGATFFFTIPKQ